MQWPWYFGFPGGELIKVTAQNYLSQKWLLYFHYKLHVLFTPIQESKVGFGVHFRMRGNRQSERAPPILEGAQLAGHEDLES